MGIGRVNSTDELRAEVTRVPTPPRFPCAKCGKETKEHEPLLEDTNEFNADGSVKRKRTPRRICSSEICRLVVLA